MSNMSSFPKLHRNCLTTYLNCALCKITHQASPLLVGTLYYADTCACTSPGNCIEISSQWLPSIKNHCSQNYAELSSSPSVILPYHPYGNYAEVSHKVPPCSCHCVLYFTILHPSGLCIVFLDSEDSAPDFLDQAWVAFYAISVTNPHPCHLELCIAQLLGPLTAYHLSWAWNMENNASC